jgi:hypothetical protein
MKYIIRTMLVFSILVIELVSCTSQENDFAKAKKTVIEYYNYYSSTPFSGHAFNPSIMHPDFSQPGIEGSRYAVVERDILFDSISMIEGDYNLINPNHEIVIKVSVKLKQKYVIENLLVKKENKDLKMDFILSKYGLSDGKYLILETSYVGYDIVFQDELERYFAAKNYKDTNKLYDSYKKIK